MAAFYVRVLAGLCHTAGAPGSRLVFLPSRQPVSSVRFALPLAVAWLGFASSALAQPDVPLLATPDVPRLLPLPASSPEEIAPAPALPGIVKAPDVPPEWVLLAPWARWPLALPVDALLPRPFSEDPKPLDGAAVAPLEPASRDAAIRPARAPDGQPLGAARAIGAIDLGPAAQLDSSPVTTAAALGATALLAAFARLYLRLGKGEALDAEPRARILGFVSQQPGTTLTELAEATGMSRSSVIHHCRMLERHGIVASRHDGYHRRLFLVGPRIEDAPRPPTQGERRILDLLREKGPLTQREIAGLLDVTPQAVSYHMLRLRREGRVEPQAAEGERRWLPAGPS